MATMVATSWCTNDWRAQRPQESRGVGPEHAQALAGPADLQLPVQVPGAGAAGDLRRPGAAPGGRLVPLPRVRPPHVRALLHHDGGPQADGLPRPSAGAARLTRESGVRPRRHRAGDVPSGAAPVVAPAPLAVFSAGCAVNIRSSSSADVCTTRTSHTAFFTTSPGTDPRSCPSWAPSPRLPTTMRFAGSAPTVSRIALAGSPGTSRCSMYRARSLVNPVIDFSRARRPDSTP